MSMKGALKTIKEPLTKSQLLQSLVDHSGVAKKDVVRVLESLEDHIGACLKKRGCGVFTISGLLKIERQEKPAVKARKGVNPFTGEEMMFKPKPKRRVVKVRALKRLKAMPDE